jgi:putative tricarboxylic transport membrane protein
LSLLNQEQTMRRDTFLKSLVAMAAAGALPLTAQAAGNVKMMIPANPGGGWDTTGRALGHNRPRTRQSHHGRQSG